MSNLQAILEYQETDKKLYAIEREISSSAERKKYVKTKKFLQSASERLDALEAKAKQCKSQEAELAKNCLAAEEQLAEFSHIDELVQEGGDVSFYKKNAFALMEKLKKCEEALEQLKAEISETDKEFKTLKKQVIAAQKEYEEAQTQYNALKASKEAETSGLKAELKKLAANVDENLMSEYAAKRKEKIFPVVGKLQDDRCPFCSMGLSIAAQEKLKNGGMSECDDCHRILYGE